MTTRHGTESRGMVGAYLALAVVLALAFWLFVGALDRIHDETRPPTTTAPTVAPAPTFVPATAPGAVAVPYQP